MSRPAHRFVWLVRPAVAIAALLLAAGPVEPARAAGALSPAAQKGFAFVHKHCSRCHAVDRTSASPLKAAPPFRTLHERYPVETLQETLAEGIVTGHPTMPEFQLDPPMVDSVIIYLKTLEL
jgi:mono/diheme cytochrome c family protein